MVLLIRITNVRNIILYLRTDDGIYTFTNTEKDVYNYWDNHRDTFGYGNHQKITNKRGCVINLYAQIHKNDI